MREALEEVIEQCRSTKHLGSVSRPTRRLIGGIGLLGVLSANFTSFLVVRKDDPDGCDGLYGRFTLERLDDPPGVNGE